MASQQDLIRSGTELFAHASPHYVCNSPGSSGSAVLTVVVFTRAAARWRASAAATVAAADPCRG